MLLGLNNGIMTMTQIVPRNVWRTTSLCLPRIRLFDLAQSADARAVVECKDHCGRSHMQTPATLIDFVSAWDIAIFVSLPLFLLITVFLQKYFGWKASLGARRSAARRPNWL